MEKVSANDKQYFLPREREREREGGLAERDWMTSNSRTAFVLPFNSRRFALFHPLAKPLLSPLFVRCHSSVRVTPASSSTPHVCSSNYPRRLSSISSFFLSLSLSLSLFFLVGGRQKLRPPENRETKRRRLLESFEATTLLYTLVHKWSSIIGTPVISL
mgnify:CR=1 FL=1